MPRCIISVSPDDSGMTRYFARRVTAIARVPIRRAANFSGSGPRRSARRAITASKRAPAITGSSIRRTVSTSGKFRHDAPRPPAGLGADITSAAARAIASTLRSTSSSVVTHDDTLMRIAVWPCQTVPPIQQTPSRCTAAITRRVVSASPNDTIT